MADRRCNFVLAAEEEDELEAEFLETLYCNSNKKISNFAEENRKAEKLKWLRIRDASCTQEKERKENSSEKRGKGTMQKLTSVPARWPNSCWAGGQP